MAQQHGANKVKLVGDFNDWGKGEELQLKQLKDGSFSLTYSVDSGAGQEYLFKYFINDSVWENDDAPDSWVADGHGGDNSMLKVQ